MEFCENGALKDYLEKYRNIRRATRKRGGEPPSEMPSGCPRYQDLVQLCEQIASGKLFHLIC